MTATDSPAADSATIPEWHVTGQWFDICNCTIPCPCTFAQAPTDGVCEGIQAWHIAQGHYGDLTLTDFNVVVVDRFEGNIWTGDAQIVMGLYVDASAGEPERAALARVFGGQAGGWPGGLLPLIADMRGIQAASIEIAIDPDLAAWSVRVGDGSVVASADALTGPTTPPGARVQVVNAPGAEVGPGQVATWGASTAGRVDGFGFRWEWVGRSSKHFPFDWSGP